MCPSYPCCVNRKPTQGERTLIMDDPSEAEVRLYAALSVSVLALELIADEALDSPRDVAERALEHLHQRYAVDLHPRLEPRPSKLSPP
jgi:hypothetical protein